LPPYLQRLQHEVQQAWQLPRKGAARNTADRLAASALGPGGPAGAAPAEGSDERDAAEATLAELEREVHALGLERHLVELDEKGFTVVPPETLGLGRAELQRLRAAVLRVASERGVRVPHPEKREQGGESGVSSHPLCKLRRR
jgi:hypothetical protein